MGYRNHYRLSNFRWIFIVSHRFSYSVTVFCVFLKMRFLACSRLCVPDFSGISKARFLGNVSYSRENPTLQLNRAQILVFALHSEKRRHGPKESSLVSRLFLYDKHKKKSRGNFENRSLLGCYGRYRLSFDTTATSPALTMAEKSGTQKNVLFDPWS